MEHQLEGSALPAVHDLDVGVIYTHERQFMKPLLTSLVEAARPLRVRLILVDNASEDGTKDWQYWMQPTTVLRNEQRLGYAANLNRILQVASAPYVLLLNTDVYFPPGEPCLAKMFHFMQANPRCGVSICRVYHPDGTYAYPARRFLTLRTIAVRRLGLARLMPRTLDRYLYRRRNRFSSFDCDWMSGCFLFLRSGALAEVGELDSRFRKYFEDVDLCARMRQAGWQVLFHGGTYCFHHEQRASRRLLSPDAWHHLRSYLYWLWKWGFRPRHSRRQGANRCPAASDLVP
jgi:GT2 family glycosyltransferase